MCVGRAPFNCVLVVETEVKNSQAWASQPEHDSKAHDRHTFNISKIKSDAIKAMENFKGLQRSDPPDPSTY